MTDDAGRGAPPVRFGVIGTGVFADLCHLPGLAAHPEVELVGVWGRDRDRAAELARRHGVVAEPDLDRLLDIVDAVAIVVTPAAQPGLAVRAAEAGCHLLLEKPMATSVDGAQRIVDAVEQAGVASLVNFTFRLQEPGASWLRDEVSTRDWQGGSVTLVAPVLAADSPFGRQPWPADRVLWESICHPLAILSTALGPAADVVALAGSDATLHLALRHERGAVSSTTVSLTSNPAASYFGAAFWAPDTFVQLPPPAGNEPLYSSVVSQLIASIRTGVPHACDVHFGAENVRVLAAAERCLSRTDNLVGPTV